jgi:pimeloyl-ACP methyl ester carboxylesterase
MPSFPRFLREYYRPAPHRVRAHETTYERAGERLPATVYSPSHGRGRRPGWVVLHGLTYTGRTHPALVRFVRAVAAAGNVVLVPDIPEWRALRVAPAVTRNTIRAAVRALHERDDVDPEHTGLFGFSFGATQSIVAACDPEVESRLRGIAAWGGYCDVHRLFRFGMTGEHELDGVDYCTPPDPYGCWIMAGNYLAHMPGFEHYAELAAALHRLALEAGKRQVLATDPVHDDAKRRLRAQLPSTQHELFDMLAPLSGAPGPDLDVVRPMSQLLADTALRIDPLFDPTPFLPRLRVPTLFAHGRDDILIPFTETIRLTRAVDPSVVRGVTITGLYAHSGGARLRSPIAALRESARFAGLLRRVLGLVG